ncbi:MAG: RagB/SusD family nutrient uptake outer membrane protein [Muribaculaceae bacterium]|nr:RagB/SusD family nutrient uptake outer membrane protein [Muribaculaceae bacterium]
MKFNKYIAAGLIVATAAGFTSCSSDFLDEHYTTGYSTDYLKTPEGLKSLTLALYGQLRWIGGYESQGYNAFMGGSDEFGLGTDQCNEMWNTYDWRMAPIWTTVNGNTGTNATVWDQVYFGIASANEIIGTVQNGDNSLDQTTINLCLAHAYFMRGYSYYILTSQFGHCALQTEPVIGPKRTFENTTPKQCWEQTISDLEQAYNLFDGETNNLAGPGVSWTKATAAHFLAKAYLFAASERNDDWNSDVKSRYLQAGLEAANYAISARHLENNVIDVYGNWTGVNCAIEQSNELLLVCAQDNNFSGRTACRNPGAFFNPQFSNFANTTLGGERGCITGGKDFQRFRPTEYTLSAFDNVNDSRLWKSFATVYGTAVNYSGATETVKDKDGNDVTYEHPAVAIGEPSVVFIINKKDEHKYDNFNFGAIRYQPEANFVDVEGRLPEGGRVQKQNGESTFGPANQAVLNSWILYKNGEYVGRKFGNEATGAMGTPGNNMFPGISKHTCGYLNAYAGDNGSRDIVLARLAETYLVRAEIKVRLNDYPGAKDDIDVLRKRGAWHAGENRSYYVDGCYAAAISSTFIDKASRVAANDGWNLGVNSYYLSNPDLEVTYASTEDVMTNWTWDNLPPEDEAILARIGNITDKQARAINFILNEHTRELCGEMVRWENLSRTKLIETRARKLNSDITFFDPSKHYVRPIPQAFIDMLQHDDGTNLTDAEKAAWQNPGYVGASDTDVQ